jgi:hypothetical protein
MKTLKIVPLLIGLALPPAWADNNATDIQATRDNATRAAALASTQGHLYDANGAVVVDSSGKPVVSLNSQDSLKSGLQMFKATTGLSDVNATASPARTGAGLADISVKHSFDFKCAADPGSSSYSAGVLVFRVSSCEYAGGTVSKVNFSVCDNPANAGTCMKPSDFRLTAFATAGSFVPFNGSELGLGCNTTGTCRLTVEGTYTVGGSADTIKAQTPEKAAGSTIVTDLQNVVTNNNYAGKMTEFGTTLKNCADNSNGATSGTYSTCDGSGTVAIASPTTSSTTAAASAECSTAKTCLESAAVSQHFEKSCVRTFGLTEAATEVTYSKTQTCELTKDTQANTSTDSCHPDEKTDLTAGLTNIATGAVQGYSEDNATCTGYATDSGGIERCVKMAWTTYWVDLTSASRTAPVGSPYKVGGACDTRADSATRTETCVGAWFGRVLPATSCVVSYLDEGDNTASGGVELNASLRAGCGVCLQSRESVTCYAETSAPVDGTDENAAAAVAGTEKTDSCGGLDLAGCVLGSAVPVSFSDIGSGLVTSQRESYNCNREITQCVKWSRDSSDPSCQTSSMTLGLDQVQATSPTQDGAFNSALIAAATVDATAKGVEGSQAQDTPQIFTGKSMSCERPTGGFLGSALQKNCCRTNLERPRKGNVLTSGCDIKDVELAAARRSSYATYIGSYCSKKTSFPRKCIRQKEAYCVFPGVLARLVQEQGRQQLAELASSGQGVAVQKVAMSFPYYDTGNGSWTEIQVANGVKTAAWKWPSYCANPELAAKRVLEDPSMHECPGSVSVWFATCSAGAACPDLPAEPSDGQLNWTFQSANPLTVVTTALSKFAVANGACSTATQTCQYTVSAWPAGVGGRAIASSVLTWQLFQESAPPTANGQPSASQYQINNLGDLMLKGFSTAKLNGSAVPATVRVDVSYNGGRDWKTLAVPATQPSVEYSVPDSDAKLVGSCDGVVGVCSFKVTGTVAVVAKSWGNVKNPDCSGFSPGQLSMLDFSKMNLDEWLSTVLDKTGASSGAALSQQASAQVQAFNAQFQEGKVTARSVASANFARIVPAEGFGPFETKLVAAAYWPETTGDPLRDKDKIESIQVDWGDCSQPVGLPVADSSVGVGFSGKRTYHEPSAYACLGNPTRNISHVVTLSVKASVSGMHTVKISVDNAWSNFAGANGNNAQIGTTTTIVAPGANTGYPKSGLTP